MSLRLGAAATLAAIVTLGLFFLMQALIASGLRGRLDEVKATAIEFVRLKQDSELETKRRLPEKLASKQAPPPPPAMPKARMAKPNSDKLDVDGPSLDTQFALAGAPELGEIASDAAPIPLVRVDPMYPPRALSRGMEGWVLVEFTITAAGTVADPRVVEADPGTTFNRSALRAIKRWKYKPKIRDGKPVDQPGIRTLISFKVEK